MLRCVMINDIIGIGTGVILGSELEGAAIMALQAYEKRDMALSQSLSFCYVWRRAIRSTNGVYGLKSTKMMVLRLVYDRIFQSRGERDTVLASFKHIVFHRFDAFFRYVFLTVQIFDR